MVKLAAPTAEAIQGWIVARLAEEYSLDPAAVDPAAPFESLGLTSRELVVFSGDLADWLGLELSPVLLYEYPSIQSLSAHLAGLAAQTIEGIPAGQPEKQPRTPPGGQEPIAIVGMAGRFPGAGSLNEFWQALAAGKDCIGPAPAGRWDEARVAGLLAGKQPLHPLGGFLEKVDEFDAGFFGISGREAIHLDPQQRLLLEVTWEALADAGLPVNALAGQPVGVYVGISSSEYGQSQMGRLDQINSYFGTGSALSIAANRLSYYFDWRGPSVAVDTACSSSLVAVHLACQSLRRGESRVAVAAGANLILTPAVTVNFNEAGAIAADGRCKAFDARADGFVRSEGVAVVVLKPLAQALADGDRVYAVVLGSAVNQDGRTNGLMAPNPRAQQAVVLAACQEAGVSPRDIAYVEAHGTGTLLGDPIEAKALAEVRQGAANGAQPSRPLRIGSVKTNVGHLEAAAGVAGLIKTALALHHRQLPPSLHFETPNPHIPFEALPLRVQTELEAWPQPGERAVAGVSSFGFGGTNAHAVLAAVAEVRPEIAAVPAQATPAAAEPLPLLLSARTHAALQQAASRWQAWLVQPPEALAGYDAIAHTAARRQTHLEHRLALVAGSAAEARALLAKFLAGDSDPRLEVGAITPGRTEKVVFVCPGQGSQWPGMGRQLYERQPVFRRSLEQTNAAFRAFVDWDLIETLLAASPPDRIDVIQPVLFALAVALADLWRALGVAPAAVAGHSMGEVAAAHIAGVLSLDDASRIICERSRLLRQISGRGLMALVDLTVDEAAEWLAPRGDRVAVAAVNGPRSVVLSGEPEAVEAAVAELEAQGVFCRRVKVDVASHSAQVDELREPLLRALAPVRPQPARLPVYSTVTGSVLAGPEMDAAYWVDNLRRPVLFAPAVEQLMADGHFAFVELSAHPVLLPAIGQVPPPAGQRVALAASMRRAADEWATLLAGLGRLHAHGVPVDWSGLFAAPRPHISLPPYPWQRERYWFEPGPPAGPAVGGASDSGHPLLGGHLALAAGEAQVWQGPLSPQAAPYLRDHRVHGQVIFPAAGYLEMALAAGMRCAGEQAVCLRSVQFDAALSLPAEASVTAQVVVSPEAPGLAAFHIAAQAGEQGEWVQHAHGLLEVGAAAEDAPEMAGTLAERQARLSQRVAAERFYADLAERGLHYGPAFQRVAEVWPGEGEALARLSVGDMAGVYHLPPPLLDAAFQVLAAAMPKAVRQATAGQLVLPVAVEALRFFGPPGADEPLWAYARLHPGGAAGLRGDVQLLAAEGRVVAAVEGLRLRASGEAPLSDEDRALSRWFYRVAWEPQPLDLDALAPRPDTWLLFAEPGAWQAAIEARLAAAGRRCIVVVPGENFAQPQAERFEVQAEAPDQFRAVLRAAEAAGTAPAGVLYAWGLGGEGNDPAAAAQTVTTGALHLAQALAAAGWRQAPRLYLVAGGLAGAPLAGLAAALAHEHPTLRATTLTVEANLPEAAAAVVGECLAGTPEDRVALTSAGRSVARLVGVEPAAARGDRSRPVPAGEPRRLRLRQPGILDSLHEAPLQRRAPGPGEIEIAVEAAGLNFLDILSALGNPPDHTHGAAELGFECAGRVSAVGEGVTRLRPGDEVVALAPGALASHVVTQAALAARKPAALDWTAAATLPIAFLTAYYALCEVARLQPGERVLIHSAASGTGLAAVQVAQWRGAGIFATAGSAARRDYLCSLGAAHVFDSRSLAFADAVRTATRGEGVDVVVNSLAGDAIPASLSLLRPRGRFIELGKRDIYAHRKVGLYALRRNLSLAVVDLAGLAAEAPEMVQRLFGDLLPLFEQGALQPLPHEVFPLSEAAEAFRRMAQARHHGKVVLTPSGRAHEGSNGRGPSAAARPRIRPDGTYVITGGLGGIGLRVAAYLVQQGARHLLLVGRSAPSAEAQASIAALEAAGATVRVAQADVAALEELRAALTHASAPLRGLFHAAGVLDDGVLLQQTARRFAAVMAPKVAGSWNLHRLSLQHPVDYFVLFSSAAALAGSPGQASYAAGNAFMDGLARWRRAQGLPALSVQWGPWAEIGLAARPDRAGRLSHRGFDTIRPADGMRAFDWALAEDEAVLAVVPFDARQWRQSHPQAAAMPLLQALDAGPAPETQPAAAGLRQRLEAAGTRQAQHALLEHHLRREIAEVLRTSPERVGPATALDSLGFDSLLALELRNRLELSLGVRLSATLIWNYPNLPALVAYLAGLVVGAAPAAAEGIGINGRPAGAEGAAQGGDDVWSEVEVLSDEAALRELMGDGD